MPPIGLHMILARELAATLRHPIIEADRGACYLGSSAPDVNVLTRWDRECTHFFELGNYEEQSGVEELLRRFPHLAAPSGLTASSASFLAGYISHLVVDEAWIGGIYRPCFGRSSALGGDALANVMDRVLQFELYRQERERSEAVEEIAGDLLASPLDIQVDFIDGETLREWRDIAARVVRLPASWDRFGLIASRFLKAYGVETEKQLARFLETVPDLLKRTIAHVTPRRVEAFLESSRTRSLEAMREYLG